MTLVGHFIYFFLIHVYFYLIFKHGNHFSFQVFITNGILSDVVIVVAITDATAKSNAHGITLFLVEDGMPGKPFLILLIFFSINQNFGIISKKWSDFGYILIS